jgi:ferredoxin-NADP reductase
VEHQEEEASSQEDSEEVKDLEEEEEEETVEEDVADLEEEEEEEEDLELWEDRKLLLSLIQPSRVFLLCTPETMMLWSLRTWHQESVYTTKRELLLR